MAFSDFGILALVLLGLNLLAVAVLLFRRNGALPGEEISQKFGGLERSLEALSQRSQDLALQGQNALDRGFNSLREAMGTAAHQNRQELQMAFKAFQDQMGRFGDRQHQNLGEFSQKLQETGEQQKAALEKSALRQQEDLRYFAAAQKELAGMVEARLEKMREGNEARLEQMRKTVEEKLEGTLQERLDASFKNVQESLERMHQTAGEMKSIGEEVGGLKRVLGNVKTRGTWGEGHLDALLGQILAPGQYEAQVKVNPGNSEIVDFAIALPQGQNRPPLWLPIDAKFPSEDYDRLLTAVESGDVMATQEARKKLGATVRKFAKDIAAKYICPPHTTDIAVLYLPTEGLFAEAHAQPGLVDEIQSAYRVIIAGPSTIAAMLSAFRQGFQSLAIQEKAGEIGKVLQAVQKEFGNFDKMLEKIEKKLEDAQKVVTGDGTRRWRAMGRTLRQVDQLKLEKSSDAEMEALVADALVEEDTDK